MSPMDDVIIIGAGPAGLSAGLFCGLFKLKTRVIGTNIGGELKLAPMIFDYPGIKSIKGSEWLENTLSQLKETSVPVIEETITKASASANEKLQKIFNLTTETNNYSAFSIILAVGNKKRRPEYTGIKLATDLGVETKREEFIKTNDLLNTNVVGVFAAGNCIAFPQSIEQLVDAAAQGTKAASQAYQYLKKQKPPILWGKASIPNL
jgi:thioredoxin reductase